jgi:hypothetical protein
MTDRRKIRIVRDGPTSSICNIYIVDGDSLVDISKNVEALTIWSHSPGLITANMELLGIEFDLEELINASDES